MRRGQLDNVAAQNQLRAHDRRRDKQRMERMRAILQTADGRAFLWSLIEGECGVHSTEFSLNALHNAHFEGKRWVGVTLMRRAQEADPRAYLLMIREAGMVAAEDQLNQELAHEQPHQESDDSETEEVQ